MDGLHDSTNKLYEHLADRENKEVRTEVKLLIKKLEDIVNSLKDES